MLKIIILILPHNNLLYAQVRYHPQPVLPALPPLLAQPIKEELGLPQASPNILDLTEVSVITASPVHCTYIPRHPRAGTREAV